MALDNFIFKIANEIVSKSSLIDSFLIFCANYFGYLLIAFLFVFLLKDFKKYKALPFLALLAAGLARFGIVEIIRAVVSRDRPFVEKEIIPLFDHAATSSFPSGHASFFFALSAVVFFYNKKAGLVFFTASLVIGAARVVSAIHWPSDILIGALIGIFSGWFVWIVAKKKEIQ